MTSKCDIKKLDPPQCNIRILDLRKNKNLQRLATRTIPNERKPKISLEYDPRNAHTVNQ